MTRPSDEELIDCWQTQPAPLLPLLHAFHDRDGFLSDDAIRVVSRALRIPLADLFGTVSFYHHLARVPGGRHAPRVCTGPICALRGAGTTVEQLDGATGMPCAGRCDQPIPVLRGGESLVATTATQLRASPSPLPPTPPPLANFQECVFQSIREPGRATLEGYQKTGGYEALDQATRDQDAEAVIQTITDSGLAGRGGAGFPTGTKWRAVRDAAAAAPVSYTHLTLPPSDLV